ncbi:MAG: DUF1343 domain-containing protein [Limnochordales bacterium]|nr:DUF1343 domain-containing protein [Limnochordales bacterium]
MRLGIDRLLAEGLSRLRGRHVGILTHAAAASAHPLLGDPLELLLDLGLKVDALFTPMHGYWSDLPQDEDRPLRLSYYGVPVFSLHGIGRRPTAAVMKDLDVLLINVQVLGCNINAHLYTLARCLEVAGELGIEVVILDRPNPVGGERVEGPLAHPFLFPERGQYRLPLRHGLTAGELALMLNEEYRLGVALSVIPMEGWRRGMLWQDTGLPWLAPSPALPTAEAVLAYGATVFAEKSGVSVGRDTYCPFTRLGDSWITDPFRLAYELNRRVGQAVRFRPAFFRSVDRQQRLGGVEMHILDPHRFEWFETALALIQVFQEFAGNRFNPRFDLLANPAVAEMIKQRRPVPEIKAMVESELAPWLDLRRRYLLYGDSEQQRLPLLWMGDSLPATGVGTTLRRPFLSLHPLQLYLSPGEAQPLQLLFIDEQGRRTLPPSEEIGWSVEGEEALARVERAPLGRQGPQAKVVGGPRTGSGFLVARWREWEVRRRLEVLPLVVSNIRVGVHPGYVRMVIDLNREAAYEWRLETGILRITCYGRLGGKLNPEGGEMVLADPLIQRITYSSEPSGLITFEVYLTKPVAVDTPYYDRRIVFDLMPLG